MKRSRLNSVSIGQSGCRLPLLPLSVVAMGVAAGVILMAMLTQGTQAASPFPGDIAEKRISIAPFHGIESSTAIEIVYTQGNSGEAVVTAQAGKIDGVNVTVEEGVLKTWYTGHGQMGHVRVQVSSPDLDRITVSSAASFVANGETSFSGTLKIYTSSAASVNFGPLTAGIVDVSAGSAGSVYILALQSREVDVRSSSAATVKVKGINAEKVTALATSAGEIVLSGRCSTANLTADSGGEVKARGLIKGVAMK